MKELERFFRKNGVYLISFPHWSIENKTFCERVPVNQHMCVVLEVIWDKSAWCVKVKDGDSTHIIPANPEWEERLLRFCKGVYQFYERLTPSDIRWDEYLHDLKADLRNNRLWANGSFTDDEIQGFEQNIIEIEKEIDAIYRRDYDSILDRCRERGTVGETFEYYLI